jgi:quercetin dioxygenase-like cupin family protein
MTRTRGTERPIRGPVLRLDLSDALRALKGEDAWKTGPRNAVTLVKEGGLRVVLVALRKGATLEPHRAEGPISIHLLSGAVQLTAAGQELGLAPGQLVTMEAGIEHALKAGEESAFLLTMGGTLGHPASAGEAPPRGAADRD